MNDHKYWILDEDNIPVSTSSIIEWGEFMQSEKKIIQQNKVDEYVLSTVFLGVDHRWIGSPDPVLFETMLFDGKGDPVFTNRYFTYDQARAFHNEYLALLIKKDFTWFEPLP